MSHYGTMFTIAKSRLSKLVDRNTSEADPRVDGWLAPLPEPNLEPNFVVRKMFLFQNAGNGAVAKTP